MKEVNQFEMAKIMKLINKTRQYIQKEKREEWDMLVLKAKLRDMNSNTGLGKIIQISQVIQGIEKGKKTDLSMSEILKGIKQPFKYYLLVTKFSKYGDEYLKCYVEKYGNQENIDEENA